jgi:GTP cyclohydrolase I
MNPRFTPTTDTPDIPDIQGMPDIRALGINKVGIKDIYHPVCIADRAGGQQHTVARFNMYVDLSCHFKGAHMSRFVEILNEYRGEISVTSFPDILKKMIRRLEAQAGHIEMQFHYFMRKKAPVTQAESLMDYQVIFMADHTHNKTVFSVKIIVPVTSLCPCSKEISKYGAHNQRSHITVMAQLHHFIWIEELIELVEKQASCELYGLLKRLDEKYVTERAYENPKFVEDMVRDIAACLNTDSRIGNYRVESENFESIHNHSAYAMIERWG